MWLFSSKGLIYFLVHRVAQRELKETPPSLLLERLTHNKFHKWQNSFLSLSFPLSSPLFSLPHPSHLQKRRVKGGADVLANKEFLLTLYLCSPDLALPLTVMRATSQFVHHLTVWGMKVVKPRPRRD